MFPFKNSQQLNKHIQFNVEKIIKQNNNLINNVNLLITKNNDLMERLKNKNKNMNSNNIELLENFILSISNIPYYIEIIPSNDITINNPVGNTLYKYFIVNDIDILKVTIDDIQINTKKNLLGFINDSWLYITIPNLLNSNKINLLKLGDETIQIHHNFSAKIDLVQVIKIFNNTVYINIYGENLFSFSKVYISYLENNYNVFIKDFITNEDYTCIRCLYYMNPKLRPILNHKVYIINYEVSCKSYAFEVNNVTNLFDVDE